MARQQKDCRHRRIKKNFPFGKKSCPRMFCKDCGAVIPRKLIRDRTNDKKKKRRNNYDK